MSEPLKCCTCGGDSSNETDIVDSGSAGSNFIEEAYVDYELSPEEIKLRLLSMKSMVEHYMKMLKVNVGTCTDEPCVDYDVELKCSKNEEICKLQRSNYKLQCQMKDLVSCCKSAKHELKNLRSMTCQRSKEISDLQKHMAALESWRRGLEREAGLCIERFEYLKSVKAEWTDVVKMLENDKKCFSKQEKKLVPRKCYIRDKKFFLSEIEKLKLMFSELYELQHTKFSFSPCPDTPTRDSEFTFAESEYMTLKSKYNEMLSGKSNTVNQECE